MKKRTTRRKRILREKRKNSLMRVISTLVIMFIFIMCLPTVIRTYADEAKPNSVTGDIITHKTAEKTVNPQKFKITLNVEHPPVDPPDKAADIVVVIDNSRSMYDKINEVKAGARNFCDKILDDAKGNVRISLITFNAPIKLNDTNLPCKENSTAIVRNFTSDKADILNGVESVISEPRIDYGSTYTKAGVDLAGDMLEKARPDAKKYVVFFTDGVPNVLPEEESKIAQQEIYSDRDSGKNQYEGMGTGEVSAILEYRKLIKEVPDVKFYTIGLFTQERDRNAAKFLSMMQNAVPANEYSRKYYRQDAREVEQIFKNISIDIETQISNTLMKDTKIEDIVTDEFRIIQNSYDCSGNVDKAQLKKTVVKGQTISFNLGDVQGSGSVSFLVECKNYYFGGSKVLTNKGATLSCIDSNTEKLVKKDFEKPTVDIPYKKGSLTVEKEVIDTNGKEIKNDDNFSVAIEGIDRNSRYNVKLPGNSSKTMNFYLKDKETDISNNTDTSLNYFTVGKFKVSETIPMNYKLEKIQIWDYKNNRWLDLKDNFSLDKDNKNVKIKVINRLINDQYWFDKAEKSNLLKYNL